MTNFFQRSSTSRRRSLKPRRARNVSRRRKQHQLGFEILEDRRVMSADSPLATLQGNVADDIQFQVQSYSSADAEGQLQILLNELYWQSLISSLQNEGASTELSLTRDIPTDPLSGDQWHLINVGQEVGNPDFQPIFGVPGEDINVASVWEQDIFGSGVVVAVIDSGVQTDHPDLMDNISQTLQLNALNGDEDGNPFFLDDAHGTAVAGLIGAIADNEIGGSGVAPGVTLAPINLIGAFPTEQAIIDAFRFAIDEIDITNNSWGSNIPRSPFEALGAPSADQVLALRDSVIFGRDGLGVIHVFASGNSAASPFDPGFPSSPLNGLDSASYDGWVNTRYTIGVTGVDHDGFYNNFDGTVTAYPEAGTSVLVAAPTGSVFLDIANDSGIGSGIYTTDTTGDFGFNTEGFIFDRDFLEDTDYTSRFNGTSAAAPIVSGVIALMLEVNPNLSWRDVQEILVRSSRQNAEFDVPSIAFGDSTQNLWITNQMPMFHDPDPWDPGVDPFTQTLTPTLDPTITFDQTTLSPVIHYQPTPFVLTNGAGYTVSQGRGVYGEEIGYAHGVVDAELAVQLAQQWHSKNQALPGELTFTTSVEPPANFFFGLPAAAVNVDGAGNNVQLVPGGLGGGGDHVAFWDEYFVDDPFSGDDLPDNTRGGFFEFSVPDSNNMTVETVEVKLSIEGGSATVMDHVRMVLISPDGTHSELNDYFIPTGMSAPHTTNASTFFRSDVGSIAVDNPLTPDVDESSVFAWTFSSNRSWGERSDDSFIFDPTTMEPAVQTLLNQGWQLHMENYSGTDLMVTGIEIVWHGSPIGANTERVQGLVGIDDNRDDLFNFSRVIQSNTDTDGVVRFGEVQNFVDTSHESMAANVTVEAYRDVNSNGILDDPDILVDQFVTGADGNYYFDLVPDDYVFTISDPLGRTMLDDSLTPNDFLQNYKNEWAISSDFFKVWDYDANLEVPLQADGTTPFAWLDGNGFEVQDGIKHLNFLLDPGPPAAPQVDFSGVVFADINGDGFFNSDDVHVPSVTVFVDANRNGQFDSGESITQTDINGEYSLTAPVVGGATVMNVGVVVPPNWTASVPDEAFTPFFVEAGDVFSDVDFGITPPVGTGPGNGTSQSGYLLGVVYEDVNGDGVRQAGEPGQSGIDVFIDSNGSGEFEAGERITTTNANGGFIFAEVAPGTRVVRIETAPPFEQINPGPGGAQIVALAGGGTVSNILFGVGNTAILDYGDLPAEYGITLLSENGARHPKGVYFLGDMVDAELDGQPDDDALGDDAIGADEDGIVVLPLVEGSSINQVTATASRHGGYLQAWVDFNGDNDFDDVGERIITNQLLTPGENVMFFTAPAVIEADRIFARFRYGEFGINSVTGAALIGEVEDHELFLDAPPPAQLANGPDFDDDGMVGGMDFLKWQLGFGMADTATATDGDANGDQNVDDGDFDEWSASFGDGGAVLATAPSTGDFDEDGDTDGIDFLRWQSGFGSFSAFVTVGDGDGDADFGVDAQDLQAWENNFGQTSGQSAPLAATTEDSSPTVAAQTAAAEPVSTNEFEEETPLFASASVVPSEETTSESLPSAPTATAAPLTVESHEDAQQRDALLSFSQTIRNSEEAGLTRMRRHAAAARFETVSFDTTLDRASEIATAGVAVRDRALDRLFARRQRPADLIEELTHRQPETEDAFALAFDEEIDWRFG